MSIKIHVDMGHPAHVHLFKHFIREMEAEGNQVTISARDKEVTLHLLEAYGFEYTLRGTIHRSMLRKAFSMVRTDLTLARIVRKTQPDVLLGFHNPYIAQCGALLRIPSLIFTDTEHVGTASLLTFPFATRICTPDWFAEEIPPGKHVRFRSFKELAYLHPARFVPDPSVLPSMGISASDPFIILRFISWAASHDTRLSGMHPGSERGLIRELEQFGRIFISSERDLPPALERYRLQVPPEKVHTVLAEASLYIGEGGTMAAEAAILGTPSIHIESGPDGLPTGARSGNFLRLRDRYGLLHFFARQEEGLDDAVRILSNPGIKDAWQDKRMKMLEECVDLSEWMKQYIREFMNERSGS